MRLTHMLAGCPFASFEIGHLHLPRTSSRPLCTNSLRELSRPKKLLRGEGPLP